MDGCAHHAGRRLCDRRRCDDARRVGGRHSAAHLLEERRHLDVPEHGDLRDRRGAGAAFEPLRGEPARHPLVGTRRWRDRRADARGASVRHRPRHRHARPPSHLGPDRRRGAVTDGAAGVTVVPHARARALPRDARRARSVDRIGAGRRRRGARHAVDHGPLLRRAGDVHDPAAHRHRDADGDRPLRARRRRPRERARPRADADAGRSGRRRPARASDCAADHRRGVDGRLRSAPRSGRSSSWCC